MFEAPIAVSSSPPFFQLSISSDAVDGDTPTDDSPLGSSLLYDADDDHSDTSSERQAIEYYASHSPRPIGWEQQQHLSQQDARVEADKDEDAASITIPQVLSVSGRPSFLPFLWALLSLPPFGHQQNQAPRLSNRPQ